MTGEHIDPSETEASGEDLQKAVEGWYTFLSKKVANQPHLVAGISHDVLQKEDNSEASRTVNFSLVDTMAPELSALGALARSVQSHVYVEGIRSPDTKVLFSEIYEETDIKPPFMADSASRFPDFLKDQGITAESFVLSITASNQFDTLFGGNKEEYRIQNTVFVGDDQGTLHGFVLRDGPGWGNVPPIQRASEKDMKTVQNAFRHATMNIGK